MATTHMALGVVATLVIIFVVPFVVYAGLSEFAGLDPPEGTPLTFLTGVFVSKVGTALAFVLIFYLARHDLSGRWIAYAFLWWLMYAIGEIGQAIGPGYSWKEAVAGIISETIYFPASAWVVNRLLAG